ncbi:MAG TPA: FAD-dependent oxidoreductase [Actinomycetota bacterium]
MRPELPRPALRSWWMEEGLADDPGAPCPPLSGDTTADVVIVGGGYTGMWTAQFLKERDPDIDVVLLEQDICGGGPSGRNGGFVNGFWDELGLLMHRYGSQGGLAVARAAADEIDAIGAWCREHGVDAWYAKDGDLGVSTSPAQDAVLEETIRDATDHGIAELYRPQTPEEVRARCASPVFRGGVFIPGAKVQPARLGRGLRRVLLEQGVRIFEGSPVRRFSSGSPVVADTPGGAVRAGRAVLGVNAWGMHWRALRRYVIVRGTYIVVTAPAPERLAQLGWTGGEGIYDFRTALHYLRTTPDGRMAFGGAGMQVASRRQIGPTFAYDERSVRRLVEDLHRWFPPFRDVPLEAAWGGPIDVSGRHLPFLGTLPGGATHYALGFTGNGVGPCRLAGRILAGLATGVKDAFTALPIVDDRPKPFPADPMLVPGERIVTSAILRKDDLEDEGRRPGPLTDLLAHAPRRLGYNLGP